MSSLSCASIKMDEPLIRPLPVFVNRSRNVGTKEIGLVVSEEKTGKIKMLEKKSIDTDKIMAQGNKVLK